MVRLRVWRRVLVACGMAVLLGTMVLQAQPKPAPKRPVKRPARPVRKKPPQPILTGELGRVAKDLGLGEAQQKMIADAVNADKLANETWEKEYERKYADLKSRYDRLSKEAKMLYDQMQNLRRERSTRQYSWRKRVSEVLTSSQMKKWIEYRLQYYAGSRYHGIELTDEQKQKIAAIFATAAAEVANAPADRQSKAIHDQGYKIRDAISAVITPEQQMKRTLDGVLSSISYRYRRAELTEAQKAKVRQLATEAIQEQHKVRARYGELEKEREALRDKFYMDPNKIVEEKLKKEILTDAQREKLKAKK